MTLILEQTDALIGFGKSASKTADWIVNTYLPNAPVSYRLSIEHAIATAIVDAMKHKDNLPRLATIDELNRNPAVILAHKLSREEHDKDCRIGQEIEIGMIEECSCGRN